MMKRLISIILASAVTLAVHAKEPELVFIEASDLTLVGKLMPTSNPYHRIDTSVFPIPNKTENLQSRVPAGMSVAFRTDADEIWVRCKFGGYRLLPATPDVATAGFDLYTKENGEWKWCSCTHMNPKKGVGEKRVAVNLDGKEREYLMYLPVYSELLSCEVGVRKGKILAAAPSPFRFRIVFFGSSYTQGIGVSRSGLSYPNQFGRMTGFEVVPLGMSGHCKMQPYFTDALEKVEADAFVFDTFSNPTPREIDERLMDFIDRMVRSHPGIPMIFQQTILAHRNMYDAKAMERYRGKVDVSEVLMKEACRKYKDVYFIHPDVSAESNDCTADGIHPDSHGYYIWAQSIQNPVKAILRKYGIVVR